MAEFVNKETGEIFHSLAFPESKLPHKGNTLLVSFAKKLGELPSKALNDQRHSLQVVESEGKYYLCKQGSSWEDIQIQLD